VSSEILVAAEGEALLSLHKREMSLPYARKPNAPEIEAAAKRRLADDTTPRRSAGEAVGRKGGGSTLPERKGVTSADVGLTYKEIHEARAIRDAGTWRPKWPPRLCYRFRPFNR
jgi:hypothetical protein